MIFHKMAKEKETKTIIKAKGKSMLPSLKNGEYYELVEQNDPYAEMDIIVFRIQRTTVCHRIIKVIHYHNQRLYKTKGDNNAFPDPWIITQQMILGKIDLTKEKQ